MIADPKAAYRAYARDAALHQGIDPDVFTRQIQQESGFQPDVTSSAGAVGIAQIVPRYHPGVDARDPYASLDYAAALMRGYLDRFGGDYTRALIAYNAGPARVTEGDPLYLPIDTILSDAFAGGETKRYVANILGGASPSPTTSSSPATSSSSSPTSSGELPTCGLDAGSVLIIGSRLRRGDSPAKIAADLTAELGRTITIDCMRGDAYRAGASIDAFIEKATSAPVVGGAAQAIAGGVSLAKNSGELIALATKPENLWRVAFVAAGAVLLIAGARLYLRRPAEAHTSGEEAAA